ncbi:MAG: hypothetical protein R2784_11580 [Saprospiraceae bacterium]
MILPFLTIICLCLIPKKGNSQVSIREDDMIAASESIFSFSGGKNLLGNGFRAGVSETFLFEDEIGLVLDFNISIFKSKNSVRYVFFDDVLSFSHTASVKFTQFFQLGTSNKYLNLQIGPNLSYNNIAEVEYVPWTPSFPGDTGLFHDFYPVRHKEFIIPGISMDLNYHHPFSSKVGWFCGVYAQFNKFRYETGLRIGIEIGNEKD